MVARGTPPSSRPPRTSVLLGMSGIKASATARNNTGSDSKRYLSKYSVAVLPERRRNVPRTYADRRMAAARADRFTSSWRLGQKVLSRPHSLELSAHLPSKGDVPPLRHDGV